MFEELYREPERLEQFMRAMAGISLANFQAFAEKFDFTRYRSLADVGGATGQLSILVAQQHPHMRCTSYDLAVVEPIARRSIERAASRVASTRPRSTSSRGRSPRRTSSRWG
jgi:hypothetical protein